ncbi:MAG: Fic family protein [archaeon]
MNKKELIILLNMSMENKDSYTTEEIRDFLEIAYVEGIYPYLRSMKGLIHKKSKGRYSLIKTNPKIIALEIVTRVYRENSIILVNQDMQKLLFKFKKEPIISEKRFNTKELQVVRKVIDKTHIMHDVDLDKKEKGFFIEVYSQPVKALLDFFEVYVDYSPEELQLAIKKHYSNMPNTNVPPSAEEQAELRKMNIDFYLKGGDNVIDKLRKLEFDYLKQIDPLTESKKSCSEKNIFDFTTKLDNWKLNYIFNTDKIEGNILSIQDVKTILTVGDSKILDKKKEILETMNSKTALDRIFNTNYELDEDFIKKLNLATQNGISETAGEYKILENCLTNSSDDIIDYTTPAKFVKERMDRMMEWYHKNKEKLHPFVLATVIHTQFVATHPFDDGNGRVARLIFNFVLIKNGYFPVIFYNSDKQEYYSNIRRSKYGDISSFLNYALQLYRNQIEEFF